MLISDDYFNSNKFKKLLQRYEASLESGSPAFMDADDLTDIADYYHMQGDDGRAETTVDFALEIHPGSLFPLIFKARKALDNENISLAEEYYMQIQDKSAFETHVLYAEIMLCGGDMAAAEKELQDTFNNLDDMDADDFCFNTAEMFFDRAEGEHAREWLSRMRYDQDDCDVRELRGKIFFLLEKYKEASEVFQKLLDDDPYSEYYWNMKSTADYMNQDYESALESVDYALAINPDTHEALIIKANTLFTTGRFNEAIPYYRKYLKFVPDDDYAIMNIAMSLCSLKDFEAAKPVFLWMIRHAERCSPKNVIRAYHEMAFIYSNEHNFNEAIRLLDESCKYGNDDCEAEIIKGHIYLSNGLADEARNRFIKALDKTEDYHATLIRIIVSMLDCGYYDSAYSIFTCYYNRNKENALKSGVGYMARCCTELKRYDEAKEYLKLAGHSCPEELRIAFYDILPSDISENDISKYIINKIEDKEL